MRLSQLFITLAFLQTLLWQTPWVQSVHASTSLFTSVEPQASRNGESVLYKIRVVHTGSDSIQAPEINRITDWDITSRYSTPMTRTTIINGKMSTQRTHEYSFVLRPRKNGNLKIPSFAVQVGQRTLMTEALTIPVSGVGSTPSPSPSQAPPIAGRPPARPHTNLDDLFESLLGPQLDVPTQPPTSQVPSSPNQPNTLDLTPPSGESFFVRAVPSKTEVYKGELITLSYHLFQKRSNISNFEFSKFPSFRGFLKEDLIIHRTFDREPVILNGEHYSRSELIRFAVFPLEEGTLTIDPLEFRATMLLNPQDIFDQMLRGQPGGIAGRAVPQNKASQSLQITSRPLPPISAAPEVAQKTFNGSVGQYALQWQPPSGRLQAQQPFSLKLTISGKGNVKGIQAPKLDLPEELELKTIRLAHEFNPDATGWKSFEYLLFPQNEGSITIPENHWTYFDPQQAEYKTLNIPQLTLQIQASSQGQITHLEASESSSAPLQLSAPRNTAGSWMSLHRVWSNFFFSLPNLLLQAGAYLSFFGLMLIRRRKQDDDFYLQKHPWQRTARALSKHKTLPADQLSESLDTWMRQRLVGYLSPFEPFIHEQSSRGEFIQCLRKHLHQDFDANRIDQLQTLWRELDVTRFSGVQNIKQAEIHSELKRVQNIVEAHKNDNS